MTEFDGVVAPLAKALEKRGYSNLTPVQQAVLGDKLLDEDMLVSAQTGSGKTVAFGLAIAPSLLQGADHFDKTKAPMALAVAPTRELALQVKRELEWLYENTRAQLASCVGGMDMRTERRALAQGAHIVVGTPGRLRDHIERGSLDMSQMKAIVLDEADEMLDMGFRDDLEYILGAAPVERRTLMFSATVPRTIANLAKRYQRDAVRVSTRAEEKQHLDIEYRALAIAPNDRENAIVNVLRYFEPQNALIFCSTRATVNHMTSRFANRGFAVVALSGELSQNERSHALQAMRDGRAQVCIATDVAARGIDLPNLELVIHADIPKSRESLLHRSGRTGRAGRKGVCTLIVPYNQRRRTEGLLQRAKISAIWAKPPTIEEITARDDERLLKDAALGQPVEPREQELAVKLLTAHGAEQIAAAYVRLYRKDQTAPEELLDNAPAERGRGERRGGRDGERSGRGRDDFDNGVWFSLSIGRKQNAEPRWLLPMLCRAGGLTKRDIGAIRIDHGQTHVELAPKCVDQFLEAIGPDKTMEKNIIVKRLEGAPKRSERGPARERKDARSDGRRGAGRRSEGRRDGEKRYEKKRPYGDKKPFDRSKPKKAERDERPKYTRPNRDETSKRQTDKPAKQRESVKPASSEKNVSAAKTDHKSNWDPLDASSKRPGRKSESRPGRKKPKKKPSPSKLRRTRAREQLRLKSGGSSSKPGQVSKTGMAPRKRKKTKDKES